MLPWVVSILFPSYLISDLRFPTELLLSCYRFPLLNYNSKIPLQDGCFQIIKTIVLHRFRT